jgi:hypothetical protein
MWMAVDCEENRARCRLSIFQYFDLLLGFVQQPFPVEQAEDITSLIDKCATCGCNSQVVKNYYAIESTIRYYGPITKDARIANNHVFLTPGEPHDGMPHWKQPPHEHLAALNIGKQEAENLHEQEAEKAVLHFVRRFGPLAARERGGTIWIDRHGFHAEDAPMLIDVPAFLAAQKLLQEAWRGNVEALDEIAAGLTDELELEAHPQGLELRVRDLWTLVRLLFLRDHASGKTKVCANPDCPTPSFLQARKGQKYCTHSCAVLVNVRRFRAGLNKAD